jgi:transcriptional regulator with XRE-family HTH domain
MELKVNVSAAGTLGGRIAQARRFAGMTQTELATAIGKHKRAVQNWEKGVNEPTVSSVVLVSEATGFPILWLIQGDGDTSSPEVTHRKGVATPTEVTQRKGVVTTTVRSAHEVRRRVHRQGESLSERLIA